MIKWMLKELWEKINIVSTWRNIKTLGKKYGKRFFWAALIWEVIEDVVFPFFCWLLKVPELIPVFLILHFEPIVYPAFFWGFKMWDRLQGREPWNPDRPAHSHHWRSILKGLTVQLSITGWLAHFIPWKALLIFTVLISLFGFVHERIWHDSNYGITDTDQVRYKRSLAKTATYLIISSFVLFPLLRVAGVKPIWPTFLIAQGITGFLYLILEIVWAKSMWGIKFSHPTEDHEEHR